MSSLAREAKVTIREDGRSGQVDYRDGAGSVSFYWEFGGGDTVASVRVGDEETWRREHGWAMGQRAEILRRVADEVIRQKAPGCRAVIDDQQGWIHIQPAQAAQPLPGTPPPWPGNAPSVRANTQSQFLRVAERKSKIMFIAGVVVVVGALLVWGAKQVLSVRVPHGTPLGDSVRAGGEIATLIQSLEPYVPSLHRDAGKDRYSVALFLQPVNGGSPGRMIPLSKHLRAQESNWSQLLGGDGRTVWFKRNEIGGIELATGKRIGPAELRAANPTLAEAWDDARRISFNPSNQRLQLTLLDRTDLEIDPQTLKASPPRTPEKKNPLPVRSEVEHFLCAGVNPSPTEWLGLHSPREVQRDFKLHSSITRGNRQEDAKELRRFHRGELGPELERGNREILSMAPVSEQEYLNAAFVRTGSGEAPLRLSTPDGFLFTFTAAPGLGKTLIVARVNADGKLGWQVDTGIDRFKLSQILPDSRYIAFIGTRPPVPDKLSEPILVTIDTQSGAPFTSTLWK